MTVFYILHILVIYLLETAQPTSASTYHCLPEVLGLVKTFSLLQNLHFFKKRTNNWTVTLHLYNITLFIGRSSQLHTHAHTYTYAWGFLWRKLLLRVMSVWIFLCSPLQYENITAPYQILGVRRIFFKDSGDTLEHSHQVFLIHCIDRWDVTLTINLRLCDDIKFTLQNL